MLSHKYRKATPIYIVYTPGFWMGEWIQAIFYTEKEAKDFIKESDNPFMYIRLHHIYVTDPE